MSERKPREFKGVRREGKDEIITFKLNPNGPPHEQEALRIFNDKLKEARKRDPLDRGATRRIMTQAILGLEGQKIPSAQETKANLSRLTQKLGERIAALTNLIDQMETMGSAQSSPGTSKKKAPKQSQISMSYLANLQQALQLEEGEEEDEF